MGEDVNEAPRGESDGLVGLPCFTILDVIDTNAGEATINFDSISRGGGGGASGGRGPMPWQHRNYS